MSLGSKFDDIEATGGEAMRYHVVSYREIPSRLRINGLPYKCKSDKSGKSGKLKVWYDPRFAKHVTCKVWDYNYVCYGDFPAAKELHQYGPWLANTAPFFMEIGRSFQAQWATQNPAILEEEKALSKAIEVENRTLTRAFDRYYFADNLSMKEVRFIFDYMAPTYEADIDLNMNLDINLKLMEYIADFELHGTAEDKSVKVLDYGVGTGICADAIPDSKAEKFRDWSIVGLDISSRMVREALEKARPVIPTSILKEVHLIDSVSSHLSDKSFNAAMACFTVHYFLDLGPYREISRLLMRKGLFVCNVLRNDMYKVEGIAEKVDLEPHHHQQLDYEVRNQPVMLLAFIKEEESKRRRVEMKKVKRKRASGAPAIGK